MATSLPIWIPSDSVSVTAGNGSESARTALTGGTGTAITAGELRGIVVELDDGGADTVTIRLYSAASGGLELYGESFTFSGNGEHRRDDGMATPFFAGLWYTAEATGADRDMILTPQIRAIADNRW